MNSITRDFTDVDVIEEATLLSIRIQGTQLLADLTVTAKRDTIYPVAGPRYVTLPVGVTPPGYPFPSLPANVQTAIETIQTFLLAQPNLFEEPPAP